MNFKKILSVNNIIRCLAFVLALIGAIMFLATAKSGYLAGSTYDKSVFVLGLIGALVILAAICVDAKFKRITPYVLILGALLVTLSFVNGILDRVNFIGDSFIPMTYPDSFYSALSATYSSFILSGVAIVLVAVSLFIPEILLIKEEKVEE